MAATSQPETQPKTVELATSGLAPVGSAPLEPAGDEPSQLLTVYFCELYVVYIVTSLKRLIMLLAWFIIIPKLCGGNHNVYASTIIESTNLNY